jgi:hypothetical protein
VNSDGLNLGHGHRTRLRGLPQRSGQFGPMGWLTRSSPRPTNLLAGNAANVRARSENGRCALGASDGASRVGSLVGATLCELHCDLERHWGSMPGKEREVKAHLRGSVTESGGAAVRRLFKVAPRLR